MHCINTSHPEYQQLLSDSGLHPELLKAEISIWMTKNNTDRFPNLNELNIPKASVNATLKIVDSLTKIQRGVFTQDKLQGWLNDLQKQGVSSQQLELFKEVAKPGMTKDEITAAIYATYSYTIEINTAKNKIGSNIYGRGYEPKQIIDKNFANSLGADVGDYFIEYITEDGDPDVRIFKTLEEANQAFQYQRSADNSTVYSNLTVPGGTNYTENEIATPAITPSIKGHAQFVTDNGIGWFRSDDKIGKVVQDIDEGFGGRIEEGYIEGSKTRRILEVQSDLFQKGRERIDLTSYDLKVGDTFETDKGLIEVTDILEGSQTINIKNLTTGVSQYLGRDTFITAYKNKIGKSPVSKNEFLQLLNKDNNWVTFFVKSIIQDSAKKGYEKVLFPSGNTASKVEGHTTLEEFKKQKKDRIAELEERIELLKSIEHINKIGDSYKNSLTKGKVIIIESQEQLQNAFKAREKEEKRFEKTIAEIDQLKQELERVEGPEGFGALRPIYNFYENTVTNILKKQYGRENIKQITDEYGNTWNEVQIESNRDKDTIFYQRENPAQARLRILKAVNANKEGFINPHRYGETLKLVGDFNRENGAGSLQLKEAMNGKWYIVAKGNLLSQKTSQLEEANHELEEKLKQWATLHNISIEAIDDLIKRFEGRYSSGILGVADFTNQLIGLAEGRAIDTLPEEVAHFAVRILKNKEDISVTRALENVIYTEEYSQVKEEYKDTYESEEQFREEALGKILAKEIVGQFKDDTIVNKHPFGLYVKAIKEKFIKWVKGLFSKESKARTQIEKVITPLAQSILRNEQIVDVTKDTSNDIFLQKEKEKEEVEEIEDIVITQKKEFLEKAVAKLKDRLGLLEKSAKSTAAIAVLEREISLIERNIVQGELDLSIASLAKLAKNEIEVISKALDNMLLNKNSNPGLLVMADHFMKMYSDLFATLSNEMYEWEIPTEEREELEKYMREVETVIAIISPKLNALQRKEGIKTLEEGNLDAYGNKIDEDFDAAKVFDTTKEDTSAWRLQVGNYKFADSKIIKVAHKIIFDSIQRVKRFAVGTANELLLAQDAMFKAGGKIEDIVEKDGDGKATHFFIREYYWDRYYTALNKAKQEMAEELGFDSYTQITKEFLTDDQKKTFNKAWAKFFKENTVKVQTEEGVEITRPNNSYKNPQYAEMIKHPATKAYYDLVIQKKKEAVEKLPVKYRTERLVYMIPPIMKSTVHRLTNKDESWMTRIGKLVKESLLVDKDDTQFGQLNVLNNKMVPIHFTRTLDSINDLSFDTTNTVTMFAEMAENFREMNKIAGQLGVVQLQLAKADYQKGNQLKKRIESNDYKALDTMLDMHVFGIERDAKTVKIPNNALTEKLGIAGKDFSSTKASQLLANFIRTNNLALNIVTSTSGWLKGSGDAIIEDQIGIYTTHESKNWARTEFFKNLTEVVGNIGNAKQTNKMHLILQNANIIELEKMLYNTTDSRLSRKLLNRDVLYTTFATGDYGVKGRITLAIYDNYRLHEGKFMTRAKFLEAQNNKGVSAKEAQKQWESLREKSLYNAYEVINGKLQVKKEFQDVVTEGVINSATGKIDQVTRYVDGTLSPTDKGALSRTILGDFLLMHRGWFIGLIDTRLKKAGTTMITEEEEIGTYRATASFLWHDLGKTFINEKGNLMAAFATWNTLSPARKRGVLKTTYDFIFLNIIAFIAALTNIAADDADDEDWTIQYAAYQMNRLLLEQNSAWSAGDLIQMIDEPVVGARMIKDLVDITEMWNTEVYERGMYADKMHMTKWWLKKLPTRNLYELQYPELKNNFIKQMVESKYYNWMTPEQANSVAASQKLNTYFSDGQLSEPVDIRDTIEQLEREEEEYNGFN